MATGDHPDIPYIEARTTSGGPAYTPGRPDGPPIWIVVHDMEYPERDTAAEWHAEYLARGAGGRSVSAHYGADNNSIIQSVRLGNVAWTVGNRPGNYRGINWELAGYASQTREQWLDPFGRAMLARVAEIMRRDMAQYSIPARTLTDEQVRTFTPGVTSHAQLGRVFGGTTHWDPGPNFPWDHLITLLGGDDMLTEAQARQLDAIFKAVFQGGSSCGTIVAPNNGRPASNSLINKNDRQLELADPDTPLDPAILVDAIKTALADPAVLATIAAAVADEQARRLEQ